MVTDPLEAAVLVGIVFMMLRLVYQVYEIQRKRHTETSIEDADRELEFDAMEMWEKEFAWKPQPRAIPARALPQLDPMQIPAGTYMYDDWLSKQMHNPYGYSYTRNRPMQTQGGNKPKRTVDGWHHAYRNHQRNPYNPRLTFSDYLIGMEQDPVALFQRGINAPMQDYGRYYQ